MKLRHAKILALLLLLGTFPFVTGILFRLPGLTWTGFAVIALVGFWFLAMFSAELWSAMLIHRRAGKPRVLVVWSKWAADEYARLGWTLRPESTQPRNGATSYLLQWLHEGDPVEVDWHKFPERKAEAFPQMQCVAGAWVVEKPNFDALKTIQWLKPWEPLAEAPPRTGFFARGHDPELVREVGRKHPLFPFCRRAILIGARSDCDDRLYWIPHPDHPFAVVHLTWAGKAQRARPEHLDTEFYRSFEDWQERRMKSDNEFIRELRQKGPG